MGDGGCHERGIPIFVNFENTKDNVIPRGRVFNVPHFFYLGMYQLNFVNNLNM